MFKSAFDTQVVHDQLKLTEFLLKLETAPDYRIRLALEHAIESGLDFSASYVPDCLIFCGTTSLNKVLNGVPLSKKSFVEEYLDVRKFFNSIELDNLAEFRSLLPKCHHHKYKQQSSFFHAMNWSRFEIAEELIDSVGSVDIDGEDALRNTVLHLLVEKFQPKLLEKVLNKGNKASHYLVLRNSQRIHLC